MDQNDLSTQTDEALGWAAEGKNLAVDVPDKAVTLKDAATFVASMTPIIGDAMSAKEIWDETQKEDPNWLLVGALGGATAIGLIPGVGDAAASLIKKGARNALDTAKRVEVDPTALGSGLGNVRLKAKDTDNTLIPSKTTVNVSNPVSKADDIIFEWEKGNIGNAELRSQLKGQGFEINNKRIGPNLAGGDLEVVDLKTGTIATWENLSRTVDVDQAAAILDSNDALKAWQDSNKIPENKRQANTEKAKAAAGDLYEGSITSKEARQIIKEDLPITSLYTEDSMPSMPTVTEVAGSLGKKVQKTGVVGVKGFDIPAGTRVGSRLDIPAYNNYDTWVVSIHDGKNNTKGSVLGYGQAVRLKNIKFGSESQDALDIARGKARLRGAKAGTDATEKSMGKATIARVYGDYVPEDPYALQEQARNLLSDPEWTQVGMNPYRQSNFYDKNTGSPVFEADEVIQVGPLVLAKGIKKPTLTQTKELAVRTKDGKLRLFNEGGLAMDDQMEAVFKSSRTDEIDPVSGNEVPTGSLPEEVRDDIPAQLSEGEYVVPADVVRYYGVKHFEDMRAEAKQGWDGMEQNDRIGGEPVGMEMGGDDLPFDVSELQIVDDGQPEQPMMNKGGYISGYAEGGSAIPTTGGVTYVMYVNSEGATMQIPFFNGVPMSVIPEGFYVQGEAPEESVASLPQPSRNDDDGGSLSPPEAVDYKNLTAVELAKMVEQQNSKTAKLVSTGISMANPLFGLLAKFAFSDMARRTENEIKRRIDSGEYQDNQGFYEGLLEETADKKPSFLKGLFDEITGKDTDYTGELLKEDTDAAVSLALSDTPISEDRQTVLSGLSNPEPGAEMSDLEAREWRTKLGYTPETTTPEVTESDVAKAGELDLPEITTTELEPSDPYVAEVAEAQVSDPRFFDVATPGLDDTPRASESDYFPSPSVSVSDSDKDSDSGSGSSLMDQTIAGARKSAANRKKYTEAGIQYGGKLITNSDGTTRAVPTYRAEDVKKAGINPGGR